MSNLREQLRKSKPVRGRRWTIRRDKSGVLTDVKMIFNPHEYATYPNARQMYGDKALLKILDKEFKI